MYIVRHGGALHNHHDHVYDLDIQSPLVQCFTSEISTPRYFSLTNFINARCIHVLSPSHVLFDCFGPQGSIVYTDDGLEMKMKIKYITLSR